MRVMNEQKIQQQRRDQEENATRERAAIVGFQYLDTREIEGSMALTEGILSIEDMYKGKLVPLAAGGGERPFQFGVTTGTPQSLVGNLKQYYTDNGFSIQFFPYQC